MMSYAGYHRHRHFAGEAAAVVAAEARAERVEAKVKAEETAQREMMHAVYNKAAAVGIAGAMGIYQGKNGNIPEYMGIPADLAVGVIASAVGVFGHKVPRLKNNKMALEIIDGIGTGSLAFWAANYGNVVGLAKKKPAPAPTSTTAKGYEGASPREFAPHFEAHSHSDAVGETVPYGYR